MLLRKRANAQKAAQSLRFPLVVKPALKTALWKDRARRKAFKVETGRAARVVRRDERHGRRAGRTGWIRGSEADHFTCNAYFDRNAQPVVTFVTRKIRQWPPQTGENSSPSEWRNDVVRDETVRLFSGVGFWGLAYPS
jgi:predicted ATP-grasp superfamily ATP-dependent carboligase